jgi:hypothetical protein
MSTVRLGPSEGAHAADRAEHRPLLEAMDSADYVLIDNTIVDAVQSDRKRLMIEGSFYKVEKRR